jgi:alkanesulfonate monooxygenase SsuD/methylene tetrahydromethanopterin reductase-like flavin-dependent oxidoreductase (luciferase family)
MKTGYMLAMQNSHEGMSDAEMIRNELRIAEQAEEFGFNVIWCAEHHFDHYSIAPDNFQLLTWLAARTKKIQLGTAAVILPWNDPLRLAEKASVLDAVSEGRFVLGLGRGLARMEYQAFGIAMHEARDRFDESARMIVNALETGFIEGTGPYYPQRRTEIRPRPLYSFKDKLYSVAMSPDSITAAAQLGAHDVLCPVRAREASAPCRIVPASVSPNTRDKRPAPIRHRLCCV